MTTLAGLRETIEAVDTALDILASAPDGALSTLDAKYNFNQTMLGRIVDALEKEQGRLMKHLGKLESDALAGAS